MGPIRGFLRFIIRLIVVWFVDTISLRVTAWIITGIRFHDLRHTAASLMLNHGVPVIMVSKILGHAKPSTTMDIYGHLIHEMQEEAARIMDKLVTPIRLEISEAVENAIPEQVSR